MAYKSTNPLLIVGPEGSGTSYVWRQLTQKHPERKGDKWEIISGNRLSIEDGIYHLSVPTFRPPLWLNNYSIPENTKIISVQRDKIHAVSSAFRRFGFFDGKSRDDYENQYDRANQIIADLSNSFELITVKYELLGNIEVVNKIESFTNLSWGSEVFDNKNFKNDKQQKFTFQIKALTKNWRQHKTE